MQFRKLKIEKTVIGCLTALLWKPLGIGRLSQVWVLSNFSGPRVKKTLLGPVQDTFSQSQRDLPVSASSCLLFFAPVYYKRHFL